MPAPAPSCYSGPLRDPAVTVEYIGSPYHKRYPWFGKPPQFRSDKTECPSDVEADEALKVLSLDIENSINAKLHSAELDGDHPRYVWGRSTLVTTTGKRRSVVWEARSTNRMRPQYHAYPIQRDRHHDSMPFEVAEALWPED